MDSLDRIFSIQDVSTDRVILKVHVDSPLTVAEFPFIKKQYQYITVTRGNQHLLTVVDETGDTFHFYWGGGGHTVLDDSLQLLKEAVIQFIYENDIMLEYAGDPIDKVSIYFNDNFNVWTLALGKTKYSSKKVSSFEEMRDLVSKFVTAEEWKKEVAPTGIDTWVAHNFKTTLQ